MSTPPLEFAIVESGCIIWVGSGNLGGISPAEFDLWDAAAIENGIAMVMELYQDDGFIVKIVHGPLTDRENADWTARACRRINAECGRILVSSAFTGVGDFETQDYAYFEPARHGGNHDTGAFVDVPPGIYRVEVYSYPPGDLSAAWGTIVRPENFRGHGFPDHPEIESESELDYYHRTRPGEKPPAWINDGHDETYYINFIVRLIPTEETEEKYSEISKEGLTVWEFRKPERFPVGIPSAVDWE